MTPERPAHARTALCWQCLRCGRYLLFSSYRPKAGSKTEPRDHCIECETVDRLGTDEALQQFAVDQVGHILRAFYKSQLPQPFRVPYGSRRPHAPVLPGGFDAKPAGWSRQRASDALGPSSR